jgi:hypothetical protein
MFLRPFFWIIFDSLMQLFLKNCASLKTKLEHDRPKMHVW